MGEPGRRADRTWALSQASDAVAEAATPALPVNDPDAQQMVRPVLEYLLANRVLSTSDAQVLTSAADHAEGLGKPLRGRAGLTSPEALEGSHLAWSFEGPHQAPSCKQAAESRRRPSAPSTSTSCWMTIPATTSSTRTGCSDWAVHATLLQRDGSAMSSCPSRGITSPRGIRMPDSVARQTSAPSASEHPRTRSEHGHDGASRSRIRATACSNGGRSLSRTAWTTSELVAK